MIFVCSDIHYIVVCVLLTLIIGYLVLKLKSSFRKFYGRHHGLVNHYGEYLWQMTTDMFRLSKPQGGIVLIHDLLTGLQQQ